MENLISGITVLALYMSEPSLLVSGPLMILQFRGECDRNTARPGRVPQRPLEIRTEQAAIQIQTAYTRASLKEPSRSRKSRAPTREPLVERQPRQGIRRVVVRVRNDEVALQIRIYPRPKRKTWADDPLRRLSRLHR